MSIYYITEKTNIDDLPSYWGGYSINECISLDAYESYDLGTEPTVIYDLNLALNEDDLTINNNTVWENISLNKSANISSLIIYADDNLLSASWKNIILKKDNFPNFPNFSSLTFDEVDEDRQFYGKTISVKVNGFESLSEIILDCVCEIISLDISDNGLTVIDFDGPFADNIRSITMRNMDIADEIVINQPTLEYLDITNTTTSTLSLSVENLKKLNGFTSKTLIAGEEPPSLTISSFKLPLNLSNFPSNISISLYYSDYFPTGLDTIEKINVLIIEDCKNINEIRNFYINDCNDIYLSRIYKLNGIKINNISNLTSIIIISNIDLVTLELPEGNLSNATVILYANINLSEIIYNGISYGKEDDNNDLVALCGALDINLYTAARYSSDDGKHRLGFNKLYIKESLNFYNINPQIYKNRELIGEPLENSYDDNNELRYSGLEYSYVKLPTSTDIIDDNKLNPILLFNVINYNGNNVVLYSSEYNAFVAFGLTEDTAASFIDKLDKNALGAIVFTDKPNLLKGLKNHKVINPFNYAPDLPNVFGIKLVVY